MGRKKKEIKMKEPVLIREKRLNDGNVSLYLDIYYRGARKNAEAVNLLDLRPGGPPRAFLLYRPSADLHGAEGILCGRRRRGAYAEDSGYAVSVHTQRLWSLRSLCAVL